MRLRTKLGGGVLALALMCLAGWYFLKSPSFSGSLGRHLPSALRRYFAAKPSRSPRMVNLPDLYLWAWERPEDLRFLSDKRIGIAFLAETVSLAPPLAVSLHDSNVPSD